MSKSNSLIMNKKRKSFDNVISNDTSNKSFKKFKSNGDYTKLETFSKKLFKLSNYVNESQNKLREYIQDGIEISVESVAQELHQHKESLINIIDSYHADCINNIDERINKAKSYMKQRHQCLKIFKDEVLIGLDFYQDRRKLDEKRNSSKNTIPQSKSSISVDSSVKASVEEKPSNVKRNFDSNKFLNKSIDVKFEFNLKDQLFSNNFKPSVDETKMVSFGYDGFVLGFNLKDGFELRLISKTGATLKEYSHKSSMHLISLCANDSNIFALVRATKYMKSPTYLYKFDKNLTLCKSLSISNSHDILCCTNDNVYLFNSYGSSGILASLQQKHAIDTVNCDTFDTSVSVLYDARLDYAKISHHFADLYARDDKVYLFYFKGIEILGEKHVIKLPHCIKASDAYVFVKENENEEKSRKSNDQEKELFVLYKYEDKWYLANENGKILKYLKMDFILNGSKVCFTNDGCLVIMNKDFQFRVY